LVLINVRFYSKHGFRAIVVKDKKGKEFLIVACDGDQSSAAKQAVVYVIAAAASEYNNNPISPSFC
jgi:hypothetical protein